MIRITLPPLRDRPGDILRFVAHFLAQHRHRGVREKTITPQALRVLQGYRWPGNVRELANTIERMIILTPGPTIDVGDLPENLRADRDAPACDEGALTLAEAERRHILRALERSGRNMAAAARRLGIDRGTLTRKLRQWEGGRAQPAQR